MARTVNKPIIGYKFAYMRTTGFKSILGKFYKAVDVAECDQDHSREPIPIFQYHYMVDGEIFLHRCGFHAFKSFDLYNDYVSNKWGRLTVELSGKVIGHRIGYRAAQQRVVLVEIVPTCTEILGFDDKSQPAVPIYCKKTANYGLMGTPATDLRTFCFEHMERYVSYKNFYKMEELSETIDAKVKFCD